MHRTLETLLNAPLDAATETADFAADFHPDGIEQTIPERFEAIVHRYPHRQAILDETGSLDYFELNLAANRIAHAILKTRGPAQEPVALLAGHGRNVSIGTLGIMKAGKCHA